MTFDLELCVNVPPEFPRIIVGNSDGQKINFPLPQQLSRSPKPLPWRVAHAPLVRQQLIWSFFRWSLFLEWLRVSLVCVKKKREILFPGWWISQENELTHILNRMADMEYDDSTFYSSRPLEERWPPLGAAVDNIAENGAKNSEHQRKWVLFFSP